MKYSRVYIQSLGYVLPPVVVSSDELAEQIDTVYSALHMSAGQLEALTGIYERRWRESDHSLGKNAAAAAQKALENARVSPEDIGALIYGGVNRENFEPATACHVASELRLAGDVAVYDLCNACLGVFNGVIEIANQIELGHIRAGLVVSSETAREINDVMIDRMLAAPDMDTFTKALATLTGGSGSAAVLLTDGSFGGTPHRLLGGVSCAAPEHHELCRWGLAPEAGQSLRPIMLTDAPNVLKHGVKLGIDTWNAFLKTLEWSPQLVDKVICHQVGRANRDSILASIQIDPEKDFSTFPYLGNTGTVSVPMTAAIAEERDFLKPGDRVAWLGIGSGLNCLMLGMEW